MSQLKNRENLIGAEIGAGDGDYELSFLSELDIDLVFLIDPYIAFENLGRVWMLETVRKWEEAAHINLDKYKHKIKWIKEKSIDAAKFITDNSLDFVYVDGNHSYEFVAEDISLYYPKLKIGGLLSGHDYHYKSVNKAVNEFINKQKLKLHTENFVNGKTNCDWWTWKTGDI